MCKKEKSNENELNYFRSYDKLSWEEHHIYQLDGMGGRKAYEARFRFLPPYKGGMVFPWGLAKMDNGEIAVAGVGGSMINNKDSDPQTVLAFSNDLGASWSEYVPINGCSSRPMMLIYMGNGVLSFMSSWEKSGNYRYYSHDYGRTWTEKVKLDISPDGQEMACEGNSLADRDQSGIVTMIAETGQTITKDENSYTICNGCIRWSRTGGRSWEKFDWPDAWVWYDDHEGKKYRRGVGEGALVRASNNWLVAALRTDPPVKYIPLHYDNFEGIAVSISKDEGATWSLIKEVFGPGRMHANLIRLPNNDLVMTVIRRLDLKNGRLASYRRGCDAVVSKDNGLTWDVDQMYILDEFPAIGTEKNWFTVKCGHLFSIALDDASVMTTYGNYDNAGALIHWKP